MAIYTPFNGAPKASGTVSINAASINAQTLSKQTFTIRGLRTTDMPVVTFPDWSDASTIILSNVRISAANTLELTFFNFHATDAENLAAQNMFYVIL